MQTSIQREDRLSQFKHRKYLGLETFRKNGQAVFTPVWYVIGDTHYLYMVTEAGSGKAKRIRHDPHVRVVPISARNKPVGEWVEAKARIVEVPTVAQVREIMSRRYGLMDRFVARLYSLVTRRQARGPSIVISIDLEEVKT